MHAQNLKNRQTIEKQETEIKELLDIVDKLVLNLKIDKGKKEIPVDGLPEGPDVKTFLSQDDKNKIEKIRDRILCEAQKTTKTKIQVVRKLNRNTGGLNVIINIFKVRISQLKMHGIKIYLNIKNKFKKKLINLFLTVFSKIGTFVTQR